MSLIDLAFHQASVLGSEGVPFRGLPLWVRWRIKAWNMKRDFLHPLRWRNRAVMIRDLATLELGLDQCEIDRIAKRHSEPRGA